jgi:cytochrome P450
VTPCIDLADPAVCADPLAAYRRAQAAAPVVTLTAPGLHMHAITRHREARAMLTDPRFAPSPASYAARPDVPDEYRPFSRPSPVRR